MRRILLFTVVLVSGLLFTGRLFYLQILNTSYAGLSENNAIKRSFDYPQRGHIYDRNGELLVSNQPSYDVMVIPREVEPFDTLELCQMLKMTKEALVTRLEKARVYSPRLPSIVIPQLTKSEYAYLQEKMRKYEGFYIQKRSLRDYQIDFGANFLGYIAEVNQSDIEANPYYQSGDLRGRTGVEKQYEDVLRGVKGVKYIQKDRFNRDIGPYKNGSLDTLPQPGKDITLTVDAALQRYGEELMVNKRGGIIAIEPATGEILALISAPNYDPALLVGRERSANFTKLWYDTISKPLFDRSLQAEYPPGSPFKTLNALIALQEGVVNTEESFSCHGGYVYGRGRKLGCHHHPSPLSMIPGIANSCNAYFANVYRRVIEKYDSPQEGMDVWNNHLASFGLGDFMGTDLPTGRPGFIPDSKFYNRSYEYPKYKWFSTATISNSIGQGEVITTPIQLANVTAAIANRGWYYTPHIIKSIEGDEKQIPEEYRTKHVTSIDPANFEPVVQGMYDVYNYGTASAVRIADIDICGKTGTAENYTKINGEREQLTDHSIFVAFAPKDNPKIAIAVFVENGYWGSRYAGKIASLMIEKHIKGEITRTDLEEWVLTHSLEDEYAKPLSGQPFYINDGKKLSGIPEKPQL
ncbi:penicillin-binding protein 2 [Leeuwenhoekiella parthenopeia]|uniref:Penicillin-binding protein 2 n=1 Tax=Leeuwenhoekiella parthenopeia TaxID=2890320 RepID=A0ABS8GUS2_9FLAO|nr:penicillin-binding protein 2 [Leeuwenhoekiella parthenopeia]MCC4213528.1 penicillin-binding protein 2 [Leeuwenhoekiella parthenopeia]